jgi:uncharacterized membrane protein
VADEVSKADRRLGALAHLGVPLYAVILPAVLYVLLPTKPFSRLHARHAIPYQGVFMALWVVVIGLALSGVVSWSVPPVVLLVALALEMPNVSRALRGQSPLSFLP